MGDKGKSYTFQQITITQKFDGASKNVTPPILSWSNKTIYAGNGNYSDKFKDLVINEQIVNGGGGGGRRGNNSSKGRGGGRDYEGTPQNQTLVLTIKSSAKKGTTYKCIANIPTIAKDKLALDDFVNALLDKHDRVLTKIEEENGGSSKLQHSKPGKRIGIGINNNINHNSRLSRTNRNSIRGTSATKKHTITPHANQQLNVYQKNVKRPSSGSFQSPGRPVNGVSKKDGYEHYDPALEEASPEVIKGNVVESPSAKKVLKFLSDKSPRNATPSKLRNGELDNTDDLDFDEELDKELDKRMGIKKKGKNKVSLDPNEDNGIVKRRRLQKASGRSNYNDEDEEDSDVEFDTEPVTVKKRNIKKRLNLAINNKDSEEQVTEDDGDNTEEDEESKGGEREGGIAKNSLLNFGFAAKSTKPAAAAVGGVDGGAAAKKKVRPSSPTPSDTYYGTAFSTSTPVRPTKKQRAPMSTPPDQGTDCSKTPIQPSTQKKTSSKYFENNNKKESNEEGGGRKLFSGNENYDNKPTSQPSFAPYSGTGSDVEEEEDVLPGYGNDDDYYNDENAYHQEDDEFIDEPSSSYKSTYAMMNNNNRGGRRGYGKNGSRGLLGNAARRIGDRLGTRARLQQNRGHPPPSTFGNNRFDDFKAGSSPLVRNPYNRRGKSIADQALASKRPRYGSPPPDQTRKSNSFWQGFGNNNKNDLSSKVPNIPGIQNLGNTCYLSVSLQTLFSIPQFIVDLNKTYEVQSSMGKKLPLTKALLEVATAIDVLDEKDTAKSDINPESARTRWLNKLAGNPVALKKQMDVLTDKFVGYEQRDAHEFLSDLVDYLHDELAAPLPSEEEGGGKREKAAEGNMEEGKATADDEKGTEGKSVLPTDEYFHLNVRVCLECDNCKYSRSKDEMYRHLSVDIGEDKELEKPWSVEQSLQQFFQPEQRELKCEKCDEGKTATQKIEIISCPKALLLHFKRFIVSQEVKSGGDAGKENKKDDTPRMEMVLRKNKVRRFDFIWLDNLIPLPHFALHLFSGKDPSRGISDHQSIRKQR